MPPIVIDRIEGDLAVLEIGDILIDIPTSALPEGAREGAHLSLSLDVDSEAAALERAKARIERLTAREPEPESDDDVFEL